MSSQYNQQTEEKKLNSIYAQIVELRKKIEAYRALTNSTNSGDDFISNFAKLNTTSLLLEEKMKEYGKIALPVYGNPELRANLGHYN